MNPLKAAPIFLVLVAVACNSILPTPTLTPTATPSPTSTMTATPTPSPTPTQSATPAPSSTSGASATFGPSPTLGPSGKLLTGVNLAGADFAPLDHRPGTVGVDYFYPTHAEVDYFVGKGMNVFRLPFNWENLQQKAMADFQPEELARLDDVVSYATGQGARVIIDPHNYARYYNKVVGPDVPAGALADLWSRLAAHYKDNPRVIFGLMNEPNTMSTELWLADANAAIAAIRQTGAANLLLVPGNAWTGAHSWGESWYGTPNATVMLGVVDPLNHYAFDAHQYLDADFSGTHEDCISKTVGSEQLSVFTAWLKANHRQAFLGEFAGARNATCYAALDDMLSFIDNNSDVWLGWTYWAAGPKWGEYLFTLEPIGGADRPQMAILAKHFSK
jgi:endoglucanase